MDDIAEKMRAFLAEPENTIVATELLLAGVRSGLIQVDIPEYVWVIAITDRELALRGEEPSYFAFYREEDAYAYFLEFVQHYLIEEEEGPYDWAEADLVARFENFVEAQNGPELYELLLKNQYLMFSEYAPWARIEKIKVNF